MLRAALRLVACLLPLLGGAAAIAEEAPRDLRESFEEPRSGLEHATLVDGGWKGRAISFADPRARFDLGPCPFTSNECFTIRIAIRTRDAGFATALMARTKDAVGASLVLGREPGRVSFEAWSWR